MILVGATLGVAFAQAAGPTGGAPAGDQAKAKHAGNPMKRMQKLNQEILKELKLTPEQETQLKDLQTKMQEKGKELAAKLKEQGATPDKKANRKELMAFRKEYQDGIKAILTTDQQKQYADLMKKKLEDLNEKREEAGKKAKKGGG